MATTSAEETVVWGCPNCLLDTPRLPWVNQCRSVFTVMVCGHVCEKLSYLNELVWVTASPRWGERVCVGGEVLSCIKMRRLS